MGISSVQSLSCAQFFATPWTAACQTSLSVTNSWSLLKLMSIESVVPSNHLILCCLLLLSPSIFPSIRVFSNESVLHIRWPKYWSFSFSISPSNEYSGLISFRMGWLVYIRVHFPYLWRKGNLSTNTVVKRLFKQSWISPLFPLILPLSHFFFPFVDASELQEQICRMSLPCFTACQFLSSALAWVFFAVLRTLFGLSLHQIKTRGNLHRE